MRLLILFLLLTAPVTSFAQLNYQKGQAGVEGAKGPINEVIKKARGNETRVRPDWYALFLLWAKAHSADVQAGLRDSGSFDNFARFMACDWWRDHHQNDVSWPQKQLEIVQIFNQRALNPPSRFRMLTFAELGPYVAEQQAFVFTPLQGVAFQISFPSDMRFGMEDDCKLIPDKSMPATPWPSEFVVDFGNPEFIRSLPMPPLEAEYFLNNLSKDEKGKANRRVVVEVEVDVANFASPASVAKTPSSGNNIERGHAKLQARRAIVYADEKRRKELARFGF